MTIIVEAADAASFEDLLSRIRPYVPRCPTEIMVQALIDTVRDFSKFTRGYTYEAPGDTITALVSDYAIALPSALDVAPISIEEMTVDGVVCHFKTPDWLRRFLGANWRKREADDFRYFTLLTQTQYTFPCIPQTNGTAAGVWYRVSLEPKIDAIAVSQAFADEWLDAWTPGALWKLKGMTDKPWADPAGAKENLRTYMSKRGDARIHIAKAYGYSEDRWANPRGFA